MIHLVGIDKGPVMDWTNDLGLDEHYRKVEEMSGSTIQGTIEWSSWRSQMQLCDLLEWRSWNGPSGQVDHWGQDPWWKQGHIEYIRDTFWGVHTPSNKPTNSSSGTQVTIPRYFKFRRLLH